jgi:hypothetical protein
MKFFLSFLPLIFFTLSSAKAWAEISYHPSLTLGFENGGDRVFEREISTGGKRGFNAGGMAVLGIGVDAEHPIEAAKLSTRVNFGFKAGGAEAENGKLDLFRWIVEASEHFELATTPVILGAGLTYHFSNQLNGTGILKDRSGAVDPSLGYFLQADYAFRKSDGQRYYLGNRDYHLGLRVTFQNITETDSGTKYNANAIGVHARHVW